MVGVLTKRAWLELQGLIQGEPQVVTSRLPLMMLPLFVGCFVCRQLDVPGILTFFQLLAFSVSATTLIDLDKERGLWMLAGLLFLMWAGISLSWVYGTTQDWLRGVAPALTIKIDVTFSLLIMHSHVKFLWKVVVRNFALR